MLPIPVTRNYSVPMQHTSINFGTSESSSEFRDPSSGISDVRAHRSAMRETADCSKSQTTALAGPRPVHWDSPGSGLLWTPEIRIRKVGTSGLLSVRYDYLAGTKVVRSPRLFGRCFAKYHYLSAKSRVSYGIAGEHENVLLNRSVVFRWAGDKGSA